MPRTGSDRALRKLVAELAATTSEDMAAVLGMLSPRSAAQVRSMLAAYGGIADVFDIEDEGAVPNMAGLSVWLAARVMNRRTSGQHDFHMTQGAIDALRQLAASMPADLAHGATAQPAQQDAMSSRMRSLFGEGNSA